MVLRARKAGVLRMSDDYRGTDFGHFNGLVSTLLFSFEFSLSRRNFHADCCIKKVKAVSEK